MHKLAAPLVARLSPANPFFFCEVMAGDEAVGLA
jgi:hypothetical protein